MTETRSREAVELAGRARKLAEQLDLPRVLSDSLNTTGCALSDLGEPWQKPLELALDVALQNRLQRGGRPGLRQPLRDPVQPAAVPGGERYYQDGVAYCDDHDIATYGTCLRGQRAFAMARTGPWDAALALGRRQLSRAGLPSVNRLNPLLALGTVLARTGDPGAWEYLDEVAELADSLDEAAWIVLARTARAEARWLEGDGAAAAAEIALAQHRAAGVDPVARADVALWHGRIERIPALAAHGARPSSGTGWAAPTTPLWPGSTPATRRQCARPCRPSTRWAPGAAARLARQRLRRLGARSVPTGARATTRQHPAGLTLREQQVLALVCAGRTNEQISAELVISVKTVDHHVSAVLAKLDVGSRRDAAAAAEQLGLDLTKDGERSARPG